MKRKITPSLLLLVLLMGVISCRKQVIPDNKRTEDEARSLIKSYPYSPSEERKSRILQNYSNLSLGMSKDQVASLLGEPDYSLTLFDIGAGDKGSAWVYYLYLKTDLPNTFDDRSIEVFFNIDGQMDWVVPHNAEGLKEIRGQNSGGS
jgi:outer membrane protein assembly factor BamE (lipoprotein component of BamABCDE complex)